MSIEIKKNYKNVTNTIFELKTLLNLYVFFRFCPEKFEFYWLVYVKSL